MARQHKRRSHEKSRFKARNRQQDEARHRVDLELRWNREVDFTPEMAGFVVNANTDEELHRWLPYRQGFAAGLVREFISNGELKDGPVLDPFSGSGTTVIECARCNRKAIGLEPVATLCYLTHLRLQYNKTAIGLDGLNESFIKDSGENAQEFWNKSDNPLKKAAVLMAASRTIKGDGSPLKNVAPFPELVSECVEIIRKDCLSQISGGNTVLRADARSIPLMDSCVGGILTSPPYLSRYDYAKVNRPLEQLYNQGEIGNTRNVQVRAHHKAYNRQWQSKPHNAIEEACARLRDTGKAKLAGVVRSYFEDMRAVIFECARVLKKKAPLSMVVAGARMADIYIPADLVLVDFCTEAGLEIEEILRARTFGSGRLLGNLENVAPREIIFSARKR